MSIRKAKEFYQSLTPQQKHFVDNKTINTTLSIKHWLAFLGKTSDYDLYGDTARSILGWRIGFYIAAGVVSIVVALASEFYYLFALAALFGVFTYHAAQARADFIQRDINNYLRLFFMPFLEAIKKKAGEEAKMSASLDFRDPFKSLTPQKSTITVSGRVRHINLYEPKIIIAAVQLADGNHLETVLLDEITKINWNNINNKSKSKTKTVHRLFIRLTVNKNTYRLKDQPLPSNVEFSDTEPHYIFKLKHKEKELGEGILKPAVFFSMLASLYHLLEPGQGTIPTIPSPTSQIEPTSIPTPSLVETMIWNDLIFDDYDRDSVMRRGNAALSDDDDSRNIFDS